MGLLSQTEIDKDTWKLEEESEPVYGNGNGIPFLYYDKNSNPEERQIFYKQTYVERPHPAGISGWDNLREHLQNQNQGKKPLFSPEKPR